MAKVKIYGPRGLIVFSSDPSQIGEDKSGNPGFRSAVAGGMASVLSHRDRFDALEGIISDRHLLASHIPVYAPGRDNEVYGVFEVYTDVTAFETRIGFTLLAQLLVLFLAFSATYGRLLGAVVLGSRFVARKHRGNRYQGAGLGLPLSRKLAEALGGALEIKSEAGRGTWVAVILPLEPAAAAGPSASIAA